ncbi:MAG: hypothetical protein HQK51_07365 [Oligoflexia bacterium]|nr:hypothetical protein [Oligoflexia bacterium]
MKKMLYSKYNRFRKESFQIQTLVYEKCPSLAVDGTEKVLEKIVEKRALSISAQKHIENIYKSYQFLKLNIDQNYLRLADLVSYDTDNNTAISFKYIEGTSFNTFLFKAFLNKDKKLFFDLLDKYYSILNTGFKNITININNIKIADDESFLFENINHANFRNIQNNNIKILEKTFLDPVFDNIIVDNQGICFLIDYEWFLNSSLPLDFIFVRAIFSCFYRKYNIYTIDNFISMEEILKHFKIDGNFYNECIKMENNFQKHVVKECNYLTNYQYLTTYTLTDLINYKNHYQETKVLKYYFHSKLWKITKKILKKFFESNFFNKNRKMLVIVLTKAVAYYAQCRDNINIFKTIYNRINYKRFNPKFITNVYNGDYGLEKINSSSICLFAHYDSKGKIDEYVVRYLKSLRDLDFSIVFTSTAPTLEDQEIQKIRPFCAHILLRKNIGIDFGSWKSAIYFLEEKYKNYLQRKCKYILLANDSVYGPLFDMSSIVNEMRSKINLNEVDLFALTDSKERKYHLQSYFLLFSERIFRNKTWRKFWREIKFYQDKQLIIDNSEVGLSRMLIKDGFKLRAYFPYKKIAEKISQLPHHQFKLIIDFIPPNPSVWFWDVLIKYFDFPFVKRELFLNHPITIRTVKDLHDNSWKEVLRTKTYYPAKIITDHIDSIK